MASNGDAKAAFVAATSAKGENASFSPNKFPGIQPWQPAGIAATKPICHIPGDLRWHGGHLGQNNYWDEWHYCTLLGVDEITGHRMSLFWQVLSRGWNREKGEPFYQPFISLHDLETGYFKNAAGVLDSRLTTEGSTDENDPNFFSSTRPRWFEQQWGNFNAPDSGCAKYFYGYCRLKSGDIFSWRTNYGAEGFQNIQPQLNRYVYFGNGKNPDYAFGPAFTWTVEKTWTSEASGWTYPYWGKMMTPQGTYYVGPKYPAQETKGGTTKTTFFEGVVYFRKDGPEGEIVGVGFSEYNDIDAFAPKFSGLPEYDSGIKLPGCKADQDISKPLKK